MMGARERAEIAEIRKSIADADDRFEELPFSAETAPMKEKMAQLLREMHRLEENLQRMTRLSDDDRIEGGRKNGND